MKKMLACGALVFAVVAAVFAVGQTVYCVPNGKKYHSTPHCRTLSQSEIVNEITLEQAVAGKLEPCKVCH